MQHLWLAHKSITTLQGEDIVFLATDITLPGAVDWVSAARSLDEERLSLSLGAGDDAVLLWPSLHARLGKTGATILRHRPTDRQPTASREVRLPSRTERQQTTIDMGKYAEIDS